MDRLDPELTPTSTPTPTPTLPRGNAGGGRGRPYPTHTPLGAIMAYAGWTASEVSLVSGVYTRTLTEYLSGRVPIREHHLVMLAETLECTPEQLLGIN